MAFTGAIYIVAVICVIGNFFILLNPLLDSISYLRNYHLLVDALMVCSGFLMCFFMWSAHQSRFKKLVHPHTIPRSTMFSAGMLTLGIVIGYAYFLVFNIAFSNCDKIIDATTIEAQWQEVNDCFMMILFCALSTIYVIQRSYFGVIMNNQFDGITRKFVNVVLVVVWVKIVVYKGYLSYKELCQRKEISGLWCPVTKSKYSCNPETQLKGTQKTWYYLHKGLLNSSIISCASEFFPVLLVAHWLACGYQTERADQLIRKRQEKKSVRRYLQSMASDLSKVYGVDHPRSQWPPLNIKRKAKTLLILFAWSAFLAAIFRWLVGLYYAIRFDFVQKEMLGVDHWMELIAGTAQIILFSFVLKWTRKVDKKRGCPHHRAEARGDMILLTGSACFLFIKLILQLFEQNFQRMDGFIDFRELLLRGLGLVIFQASQWLQLFALRRIMALNKEDCRDSRSFLPSVAICSLIVNWVSFGMTFFETNLIKYQLSKPEFKFSQATLISMIFTQTIYPADYLFSFTAAGCWTDIIIRYIEMGWFKLGIAEEKNSSKDHLEHSNSKEEKFDRAHYPHFGNQLEIPIPDTIITKH